MAKKNSVPSLSVSPFLRAPQPAPQRPYRPISDFAVPGGEEVFKRSERAKTRRSKARARVSPAPTPVAAPIAAPASDFLNRLYLGNVPTGYVSPTDQLRQDLYAYATPEQRALALAGDISPRREFVEPTAEDYLASLGGMAAETGTGLASLLARNPTPQMLLQNIVSGAQDIAPAVAANLPSLSAIPASAAGAASDYASYAASDPANALADFSVVGAGRDFLKDFGRAAQLRAEGRGDEAARIEQLALPLLALGVVPGGKGARVAKEGAEELASLAARPVYRTVSEGPFTRVAREGVESEIRTAPAALTTPTMGGLRAISRDPAQSDVARIANEAALAGRGVPYDFNAPQPVSSLARQAGIGRAYQEAVSDNPAYKSALFERIGETMPEVVEKARAQNLDQLTEAAYQQLGGEVAQQFDRLPLTMRYHTGAGEYASPNAMMQDVLGRGNLNVFSGGEPHEFLSRIDPATGLSQNEMFRAVHDYMGHVVPGSMFGAPGEEIAYAAHSQTLSPLAQLALLSETRGQNSWVNYSPANVGILDEMNRLKRQISERTAAERFLREEPESRWAEGTREALAQLPPTPEARARLRELGGQFEYAPQRAVLLPPEYLDPMTEGGMPEWLRPLLNVKSASNDVRGVHFSRSPELAVTDPAMYGTGARSGELPMVRREGLPNRTYFYSGPEGTVVPEPSVGQVAPNVYETTLSNLYDVNADPEGLVRLARAYNLSDYQPRVPEALAYSSGLEGKSLLPDMERLIRDYGYSGFLSDTGRQRAAAVYDPVTGLRRIERGPSGYASGGAVS